MGRGNEYGVKWCWNKVSINVRKDGWSEAGGVWGGRHEEG